MLIYGLLGVLAWQTLADEKIRLITLAILGMFALKTLLHHRRDELDSQSRQDRE